MRCAQNSKFLSVKPGGTYSYHFIAKAGQTCVAILSGLVPCIRQFRDLWWKRKQFRLQSDSITWLILFRQINPSSRSSPQQRITLRCEMTTYVPSRHVRTSRVVIGGGGVVCLGLRGGYSTSAASSLSLLTVEKSPLKKVTGKLHNSHMRIQPPRTKPSNSPLLQNFSPKTNNSQFGTLLNTPWRWARMA
jgi:hypothetical protein